MTDTTLPDAPPAPDPTPASEAVPPPAPSHGPRFAPGTLPLAAVLAALLCAATAWTFLPLRHAEFLNYGDTRQVTLNPFVREGFTRQGVIRAFTDTQQGWQPLAELSHMLDCSLFGLDPGAHHLSGVLLHVAGTAMLLFALLRLSGALWPSVFVAAMFALHPLHVEPVAWITARPHLLAALLWSAALFAWAEFAQRRSPVAYGVVAGCMVLDALNQGTAVALPLVLLLLDRWPLDRRAGVPGGADGAPAPRFAPASGLRLIVEKAPLFAVAAATLAVRLAVRQDGAPGSVPPVAAGAALADGLLGSAVYLRKTIWPAPLAMPYPMRTEPLGAASVAASILFLLAVTGAVVWFGRRRRYLVTGWLWYLVTLLAGVGLADAGQPAMADRYAHVPLIGIFVMAAWGAAEAVRRAPRLRPAIAAAAALAVLLAALATRAQLDHWRNSVALFEHTVAKTTDNFVAELQLGLALKAAGRGDESRQHQDRAFRLAPASPSVHNEMAARLLDDDEPAAAERHLREALRLDPDYLPARLNLGLAQLRRGAVQDALEQFGLVLRHDPGNVEARRQRARVLEDLGNLPQALAEYQATLLLAPNLADAHLRTARVLEALDRLPEATVQYRLALQLRPQDAEIAAELARTTEALVSDMTPDDQAAALPLAAESTPEDENNAGVKLAEQGKFAEAEPHFRRAVRMRPLYAVARRNLGLALLKRGDTVGARRQFSALVAIQPFEPLAHFALAQALDQEGRLLEARLEYERVTQLSDNAPEAHLRIAELREKEGDPDAALRHYRETLRLAPSNEPARAALDRLQAAR